MANEASAIAASRNALLDDIAKWCEAYAAPLEGVENVREVVDVIVERLRTLRSDL